jgi:hypothetical protein
MGSVLELFFDPKSDLHQILSRRKVKRDLVGGDSNRRADPKSDQTEVEGAPKENGRSHRGILLFVFLWNLCVRKRYRSLAGSDVWFKVV